MEANQCDGCKRGLAVKGKIHIEKDGKPYMRCSSSLYEKRHRPSDLEIVQKSLIEKFGGSGCLVFHHGGWVIETDEYVIAEGNDTESLLTWAKQTIGE